MQRQRCAMTARGMENDSRVVRAYGVLFVTLYNATSSLRRSRSLLDAPDSIRSRVDRGGEIPDRET
jgi:hypothetical protein